MVDQSTLTSRLSALERYLARLHEFRSIPREQFIADEDVYQLAERYLHLACECLLDVAHHVVSDLGFRQPEGYRDVIDVLCEERLLSAELAERLRDWVGFRNVLVHFYLTVDHGRSYDAIEHELGDLEAFARSMAVLLED